METEVIHTIEGRKFYIQRGELIASLRYCIPEEGVLELQFTYVPPMLREQGMAKMIIKAALEYARKHKYRVIPTCRFVAYYMEKNDEYKDLLYTENSY